MMESFSLRIPTYLQRDIAGTRKEFPQVSVQWHCCLSIRIIETGSCSNRWTSSLGDCLPPPPLFPIAKCAPVVRLPPPKCHTCSLVLPLRSYCLGSCMVDSCRACAVAQLAAPVKATCIRDKSDWYVQVSGAWRLTCVR